MPPRNTTGNPLATLASKATKTKAKPKDTLDLHILKGDVGEDARICMGLNVVVGNLEPVLTSRVNELKDHMFEVWTEKMWDSKSQPRNIKVVVQDQDGRDDASMTFQVQFRSDGLRGVFPDELPANKTVEDLLHEALTSDAVGLSDTNAKALINPNDGDILVTNQVGLVDTFDKMLSSSDENIVKAAQKLINLALASDKGQVKLLTDADRALLFRTRQVAYVKDGFFERVFGYCRNITELRKLLRFLKVRLVAGNFNFAISSPEKERVARLESIARQFISVSDE